MNSVHIHLFLLLGELLFFFFQKTFFLNFFVLFFLFFFFFRKPLPVQKIENPTPKQVNELHSKFTEAIEALYERHKATGL